MSTHSSATTLQSAGPSSLWKFISIRRSNTLESTSVSPVLQNSPVSIPNPPPPVYHSSRASTTDVPYTIPGNAFDSFFGALPQQNSFLATRAPSSTSTLQPPPYSPYRHDVLQSATSDVYAAQEPPTFARFFFLYGFIFFPFWILGTIILVSPLRPTPDWEDGKTELEREQLLKIIRSTEKKWAYRCLYAFSLLAFIVILIAITIRFAFHLKSQ